MWSKITGNKFICMVFTSAICICKFIFFNTAFRNAYFSIINIKKSFQSIQKLCCSLLSNFAFKLQINNLVDNASALSLVSQILKVFTRYEACQCKIPPTNKNSNSAVRKFPQMPSLISPCEHKFLPPEKTLKSWRKQLQDITAIVSGDYFVETNNGYYSVDTIHGALQYTKLFVLGSL